MTSTVLPLGLKKITSFQNIMVLPNRWMFEISTNEVIAKQNMLQNSALFQIQPCNLNMEKMSSEN